MTQIDYTVRARLSPELWEQLTALKKMRGLLNTSELIRCLIREEYNRVNNNSSIQLQEVTVLE